MVGTYLNVSTTHTTTGYCIAVKVCSTVQSIYLVLINNLGPPKQIMNDSPFPPYHYFTHRDGVEVGKGEQFSLHELSLHLACHS